MFHRLLSKTFFHKYLEHDEQILFIAHRHLIILFWDLLQLIALGVLLPIFMVASNPELFPAAFITCVFFILRFLHQFLLWFFDCWLFTNRGVIDIRWVNLFNRQTINVGYKHCEGMTVSVRGFWHTILQMGDMVLERDSSNTIMKLHNAYHPHSIEEKFLKAKEAWQSGDHHVNKEQEKIKLLLAEMLQEYAASRGINIEE